MTERTIKIDQGRLRYGWSHTIIPGKVKIIRGRGRPWIVYGVNRVAFFRNKVSVIIGIDTKTQAPLPQIAKTSYRLRLLFGRGQRRQKQSRREWQ